MHVQHGQQATNRRESGFIQQPPRRSPTILASFSKRKRRIILRILSPPVPMAMATMSNGITDTVSTKNLWVGWVTRAPTFRKSGGERLLFHAVCLGIRLKQCGWSQL